MRAPPVCVASRTTLFAHVSYLHVHLSFSRVSAKLFCCIFYTRYFTGTGGVNFKQEKNYPRWTDARNMAWLHYMEKET